MLRFPGDLKFTRFRVREAWPVLQRAEDRLAHRVVVAHAGTTEGCGDTEPLERREHRRALHGAAIVGVEHELAGTDALGGARVRGEGGREVHRLLVMDLPRDDLSTPDVEHEVEVVEGPSDRGPEVRDVPGPYLTGAGRDMAPRLALSTGRPCMAAMRHEAVAHVSVPSPASVPSVLASSSLAPASSSAPLPEVGVGADVDVHAQSRRTTAEIDATRIVDLSLIENDPSIFVFGENEVPPDRIDPIRTQPTVFKLRTYAPFLRERSVPR